MMRFNSAARVAFAVIALLSATNGTRADDEKHSAASGQKASAMQHGYAPVNGLKMYYEVHGSGEPLVLLHGGGSSIETTFGKILPTLAKSRKVIAFEQQGHGRTNDIDARPYTFEQSADDADALLQHLGIERADLFGFSNGGNIAMQMAIRHPARVRKLIVASAMYKRDGMSPGFWEFMKQARLSNMPQALQDEYRRLSPHPEKLQMFHDKCAKRMLEFQDWRAEDLQSIDAPMLLMVGDSDAIRPEHTVEMYRLLPHAQLAIFPGGHGAYIGEVTAGKIEDSKIQFGDANAGSKKASKLPDLVAALVEEFLDAPMPKPKAKTSSGN